MSKAVRQLVKKARSAANWIERMKLPNEPVALIEELRKLADTVEREQTPKRTGSLVLVEIPGIGRRITATVEDGDKYLSRSGLATSTPAARVLGWAKVADLYEARAALKEAIKTTKHRGMGMSWAKTSAAELRRVMNDVVAQQANQ